MKKNIIFLSLIFACTIFAQTPFILITVLYNETHRRRMAEYITCLEYNLKHKLIEKIHVIYDTSKDDDNNILLRYLQSKDIEISFVNNRPTYGYCFDLANELYSNRSIILSNADIYFNHTLKKLKSFDLTNTFLTITRWNIKPRGRKHLEYVRCRKPNIWSHDTWIFKTPLKCFENDAIQVGTVFCDCRIAYQAKQAGLRVLNPCLSIECCHVHLSRVRHRSTPVFNKKERLGVPWCALE